MSAAKVKKTSVVFYKIFEYRRYNEKSKDNLIQNQKPENENSNNTLKKLQKIKTVNDINAYGKTYERLYKEAKGKNVKFKMSDNTAKKLSEITNVFVSSILSSYQPGRGFKQRSVSFVTLTLSEPQKHTDKEITKTFIEFVKHIRKVNNYIIRDGKLTREKALKVDNYVWRSETQENGNIHFHLLFDTYFNHHTLRKIWNSYLNKLGYQSSMSSANIHAIKNLKDVGAYVTKYLTKAPLNDKTKKMIESGEISKNDLDKIPDSEKFRRPVLAACWGCSNAVKKLKYPVFVENETAVLNELCDKLRPVELDETAPEYIKVFAGNVKSALKKCSIELQAFIKHTYKNMFKWLYTPPEKIMVYEPEKSPVKYYQGTLKFI
ncbi:hypothetical protein AAH994_06055 [Weeksellaceae bacterium A-14]